MSKYKITVSKDHKKYTIVYEAETENLAKDRVHKEGYSILSVEKIDDLIFDGNEFIFEAEKNGILKKGKVVGDDIFKIYLKLRDGLDYNIKKIYIKSDEGLTEKQKESIVKNLEEQYYIFKNIKGNNKKEKKEELFNNERKENIDDFYMKKELEETYKLIDFVLLKLKNVIEDATIEKINLNKKEKLTYIYNNIIKIKGSTNISKLKEIGELALVKVGEIELKNLEKNKSNKSKKLLNDTNKLLKDLGSHKQFIEKQNDIKYIFQQGIKDVVSFINYFKIKEDNLKEKEIKDKSSYSYLKTISLLKKYNQRLTENNLEIIKNIAYFIFPFLNNLEKKEELLIKRSVIKQNISLLKAKKDGEIKSYTKIVKGYTKILDYIFLLFLTVKTYIFYTVIFYSFIFIILLNLNYYSLIPNINTDLNYNGVFYFIVLLFIYFSIYFSKNIYYLFINFVFLSFVIIFGVVNF